MRTMHATGPPSTPASSPGETVFLAVLGGVAALGGVVWAGAAVAAATVGEGPPGGLPAALRAIPGLVRDPGHPAGAWPPAAGRIAAALPGPVAYWLSTVLVAAAAGGVAVFVRRVWRAVRPQRRSLGVDAEARFATRRELRPMLVP